MPEQLLKLFLGSEPVSPLGSGSSEGIINQLGRPHLDMLAVLMRESVQNSWDARSSDSHFVSFKVHGRELSPDQRKALTSQVFFNRPDPLSLSMDQLDDTAPLIGLYISDRGTIGLAGPTRADNVSLGAPRNFINFLRNTGHPSTQQYSGGTYGYGKASLYRASGMQTILVYTRCKLLNGKLESRFIAAALGNSWSKNGKEYTGRHWWGKNKSGIVEPIINEEADKLAISIGMDEFVINETGTTILILDPFFNDRGTNGDISFVETLRTPIQALNLMAEFALWFFWPKMLIDNLTGKPAIKFHFQWNDMQICLPDPAQYPPLGGFVRAYNQIKGQKDDTFPLPRELIEISSERPKKYLGKLALEHFVIDNMRTFNTGESAAPFENITYHTALMRNAELIVKYLPGRPLAGGIIGYAGVFISDLGTDDIFAASEPPTHDDWIPQSLTNSAHKTYVNVALRKIFESMSKFSQHPAASVSPGRLAPLGAFATWLGESLIPVEQGSSAKSSFSKPRSKTSGDANKGSVQGFNNFGGYSINSRPQEETSEINQNLNITKPILQVVSNELIEESGSPTLRVRFNVAHGQNTCGSRVIVKMAAVLDNDTIEGEPPLGGSTATIKNWISPSGEKIPNTNNSIKIDKTQSGVGWQVLIFVPDDIMLNLDIDVEAEV